jgi:tricorn protease
VLNASGSGSRIVYEQAGYLHALDLASGQARKLTIGVNSDLGLSRPRWVSGAKYIRNASISPSGARVAYEFRGEIVTIPADKGDVRNLTQTSGANERSPAWSPDGRSVAYFSDESGEYMLHIRSQDGKGEPRKYKLTGAGFYDNPAWSPDSKKIAYVDNAWTLYVLDVPPAASRRSPPNRCMA